MDKRYSNKIELVRRQYSGNEHGVVKGIGVVNCVYVNPDTRQFWIIDFRIYDPGGDGQSKLKHVEEMLNGVVFQKKLPFREVLMDSWYAEKNIMLLIDSINKRFYCPLKKNRLVDDSGGVDKYKNIEKLGWSEIEKKEGKLVKIKKFPGDYKVKLFRVIVSKDKTEYIATNDISQCSTNATKDKCGIRWKIEEFHRELKQTTGVEGCECRKQRIQRNHIACCMLVWVTLKDYAYKCKKTIYQLKKGLLHNYLINELKNPRISVCLA
ncbi:transposase (fragment) [groundwater metagenome]|uniref:Transposase n=1 Tax=groundwater metagenome TaxID=717931 RepID=A0A098EG51_9ZZZZ